MPGVPLDAVSQVKKGFKSLFRKKHDEAASPDDEPTASAETDASYDPTDKVSTSDSQSPSAPTASEENTDWQNIDQEQPPTPPEKDTPTTGTSDTLGGGTTPNVVVTPAPGSEEAKTETPAAEPSKDQSRAVPPVVTQIKAAKDDDPVSASSQASTLAESHASPTAGRDDSPAPAMSATSGPLTDQPSFQ